MGPKEGRCLAGMRGGCGALPHALSVPRGGESCGGYCGEPDGDGVGIHHGTSMGEV